MRSASPAKPYKPNPTKRRQWLHRVATDSRLSPGCRSWLLLLADRSNDAGKAVWGRQTGQASAIGRCDRQVRRYRLEAETLGYVTTVRSEPQRAPGGEWARRRTNRYHLRCPNRPRPLPSPTGHQRPLNPPTGRVEPSSPSMCALEPTPAPPPKDFFAALRATLRPPRPPDTA